ncbi:glutamate--tRNA ligase [Candidatus Dependentiae bacterium]|nr:glutamate--tRNA ligase [Candidatus Dependentiae bacterium]
MSINPVRVRFAPSPTGIMHLGNVRAALINYLFARQKGGTFILRIEDTDTARNISHLSQKIIDDLAWLGLNYDEGPEKNGIYAPYYQSERTEIYKKHLKQLEDNHQVYRCFCTVEELEKKRQRQIALKQPPRYDRTCANLTHDQIAQKLNDKIPFIWRFKLDQTQKIHFYDLAHKEMYFDLANFADFPLTRQDGSFTFIFANFVDDMTMKISHVFRGEDHLTNTACQVALYNAFNAPVPVFWHLPIIGNAQGKKLSKRDFGFSLDDLKNAGFLPQAICNYLSIIGGSFEKEIMSLEELIRTLNFEAIASTSKIRYDTEKLKWVNHNWIKKMDPEDLLRSTRSLIEKEFAQSKLMKDSQLIELIKYIQPELFTLNDVPQLIKFYFFRPEINKEMLHEFNLEKLSLIIEEIEKNQKIKNSQELIETLIASAKLQQIPNKDLYHVIRLLLFGSSNGPSIKDLANLLGLKETKERLFVIRNYTS